MLKTLLLTLLLPLAARAADPAPQASTATALKKVSYPMTLPQFADRVMLEGADYEYSDARAKMIELPVGSPSKNDEVLAADADDGMDHSASLVLTKTPKPKPFCWVFLARKVDAAAATSESFYFRVSQGGGLVKAFIRRGQLGEDGKPVHGSGTGKYQENDDPAVKKRLRHELDFWLKGLYRKSSTPAGPTKPAK